MGRMVKRLSNLDIDEVSLVDVPANQHGTVTIAKNHQEDEVPDLFDADGNEVFEDELQVGDFVYDGEGTEFRVSAGDDQGAEEYEDEDERELASVGKSVFPLSGAKVRAAGRLGRRAARDAGRRVADSDAGQAVRGHASRNRGRYALGGAAAAGAGVGYGAGRVGKSLGDQVLEELSKAYTEEDRDSVIAKALGQVEEVIKRNEALEETVVELLDDREEGMYREVAKGYGLGNEDAIGGLLHRASQVMDEDDVRTLDRFFAGMGEIQKSLFDERGLGGGFESDTLDQVYAMAGEAVSKGDGSLTTEQAVTAMFNANPDAYDQYEAETRLRG